MTAIQHYWLRGRADPVAPPAANAVFAWPCFPSKLTVQGTGNILSTAFPLTIHGKLNSSQWDGYPDDHEPCDLVMIRNSAEQAAQTVAVGYFSLTQTWCVESRVGWSGGDTTIIVQPFRTAGFYVHYNVGSRLLSLRAGAGLPLLVSFLLPAPGLVSNVLHHWAATYDNGTLRIWINGALIIEQAVAIANSASSAIALRYENAFSGELYIGGVRYWDYAKYAAPFTPPTQLTIP